MIYDNDGPGFAQEFFERPGFQQISPKIRRYIPESSVIGMLLGHAVQPIIIQSSQKAVMQHDGLSWEVLGANFLYCEKLSNFAAATDQVISEWLEALDDERRDQTIDDLFAVLDATKATTLTELQEGGIKNIKVMLKEIEAMDSESKEALQGLMKAFLYRVPQMLGISLPFTLSSILPQQ